MARQAFHEHLAFQPASRAPLAGACSFFFATGPDGTDLACRVEPSFRPSMTVDTFGDHPIVG